MAERYIPGVSERARPLDHLRRFLDPAPTRQYNIESPYATSRPGPPWKYGDIAPLKSRDIVTQRDPIYGAPQAHKRQMEWGIPAIAKEVAQAYIKTLEAPRTGIMPSAKDLLDVMPMTQSAGLLTKIPAGSLATGPARRGIISALKGRAPEKSDLGFYSPTEKAALNLEQKSFGNMDQAKAALQKIGPKRFIDRELEWRNWDKFAEGRKKVTKDEIVKWIRSNPVVMEEVTHGGLSPEFLYQRAEDLLAKGKRLQDNGQLDEARKLFEEHDVVFKRAAELEKGIQEHGIGFYNSQPRQDTISGDWITSPDTLEWMGRQDPEIFSRLRRPLKWFAPMQITPGGTKHREINLTMPHLAGRGMTKADIMRLDVLTNKRVKGKLQSTRAARGSLSDAEKEEYLGLVKLQENQRGWDSPHAWELKNPILHVRVNERVVYDDPVKQLPKPELSGFGTKERYIFDDTPIAPGSPRSRWSEPKKTLHVDEFQSDMLRKGAEVGFKKEGVPFDTSGWTTNLITSSGSRGGTEIWPHSWTIRDKNGDYVTTVDYNSAALTSEDAINVARVTKENEAIPDAPFKTTWPELAIKRLITQAVEEGYDRISWTTGLDHAARYGQEGQKLIPFYDKHLRNAATKVLKELDKDATVSTKYLAKEDLEHLRGQVVEKWSRDHGRWPFNYPVEDVTPGKVWNIEITPKMKEMVRAEGLAMPFAAGGPVYASEILHMAKGGPPDLYEEELFMGIPSDEQIARGQRNKEMIEELRAQRDLAQRDAAIQEANLQAEIEGRPKGGSGLTGFDPKEAEYIQQSMNLVGGAPRKIAQKAIEEGVPLVRQGVGALTRYVTGEPAQEPAQYLLPFGQRGESYGPFRTSPDDPVEVYAEPTLADAKSGGTFFHAGKWSGKFSKTRPFHVGNRQAALDRVRRPGHGGGSVSVHEITVTPKNPYLPEGRILDENKQPDKTRLHNLNNLISWQEELRSAGYDVVPYINSEEAPGSLSYMILDPSSVEVTGVEEGSISHSGESYAPTDKGVGSLAEEAKGMFKPTDLEIPVGFELKGPEYKKFTGALRQALDRRGLNTEGLYDFLHKDHDQQAALHDARGAPRKGTTAGEVRSAEKQLYEAGQDYLKRGSGLEELPKKMYVYRYGKLFGNAPVPFTTNPKFSGYGVFNKIRDRRTGEETPLVKYEVDPQDILAVPNSIRAFKELMPGSWEENEVIIAGDKVTPVSGPRPDPIILSTSAELERQAAKLGEELPPFSSAFTDLKGQTYLLPRNITDNLGIDRAIYEAHEKAVPAARILQETDLGAYEEIVEAVERGDVEAVKPGTIDYYNRIKDTPGLNRASIEEEVVVRELALQEINPPTNKAHGGPIYASEALHMQGGGDAVQEYLEREMLKVNEGGDGSQDIFRPTTVTLPPLLKLFEDIKIRHEEVPQSRPSVKRFPGDPPPPPTGSPIIEESFGFPLGPAQGTVFRTRVPKRAVGTTPSGAVMRDSEELGVRVEGLPVARVGPVSVALNIDLFKTKEGISGPGIKHTIGSQLKRFGIIGQGEDFRLHFDRTTTDVKGGPSQTEHSGSLVVNVLRDEKFGTADVYVNANELEGKLEGSVGIRGGFKFAEGGLASMAPEARGMFGKPHPMTKEPRLTDLGPGTNPGVASLCSVARNMNRSVVA